MDTTWCAWFAARPRRRPTPRRRSPGTLRPGICPARRSTASTRSSTSPAPASATTAGPTRTSASSSTAACAPPTCWPRRIAAAASAPGGLPVRFGHRLLRRPAATRSSTRSATPGTGFLADVCVQWEAATAPAGDGRHTGRSPAHRHRAVTAGRCAEEDAAAVQAGPRRQVRQRPAVAELDLARRRGGRHRAPADRRRARSGEPDGARTRSPTPSSPRCWAGCCTARRSCRCRRSAPSCCWEASSPTALLFTGQQGAADGCWRSRLPRSSTRSSRRRSPLLALRPRRRSAHWSAVSTAGQRASVGVEVEPPGARRGRATSRVARPT